MLVLAKHSSSKAPSSGLSALGRAVLCADDDSLVSRFPRISRNTHCHSDNISKMHDFSEVMENSFHVLDYPVLARLLLDGGHEG